jgi:hypothetical protein
MARINGKCVVLCDFCVNGGECLDGHQTTPAYKMDPAYYGGVDHMKTGDELITQERDRVVDELGKPIAYDLAMWRGDELENSILTLLTRHNYQPNVWGDDDVRCAQVRGLPVQVRRVMAGALLCALIDVDNLKYQILTKEQNQQSDALRGNKKG